MAFREEPTLPLSRAEKSAAPLIGGTARSENWGRRGPYVAFTRSDAGSSKRDDR